MFFCIVCAMMGFCFSGLPTSMAVFMLERFGQKYYPENVAGFNTVMIPQSIGTALFAGAVVSLGSYGQAYLVFLIPGLLVLIGSYFLARSLTKNKGVLNIKKSKDSVLDENVNNIM